MKRGSKRRTDREEDPVWLGKVQRASYAVPLGRSSRDLERVRRRSSSSWDRQFGGVRYLALTCYLHVVKLVSSDFTAFGLACAIFLCKGYFQICASTVLGWISTSQFLVRVP